MAITYVNKDIDSGDAASWSHSPPTNWAVDDIFIAVSMSKVGIDLTSGWTNLFYPSANNNYLRIQYKVAVSGDSTGWTFTGDDGDYNSVVLCYTGINASNPINTSGTNTGDSEFPTCPTITTDEDNCMILTFPCIQADNPGWITTFGTNRDEQENGSDYTLRVDEQGLKDPYGATGTYDYEMDGTGDGWGTMTLALEPESADVNDFSTDPSCVALWDFETSPGFLIDGVGDNDLTNDGVDTETTTTKVGDQSAGFVLANTDNMSITDANQDAGFPYRITDGSSMIKDMTFCFWLYLDSLPSDGTDSFSCFSKYGGAGDHFFCGIYDTTDKLSWEMYYNGTHEDTIFGTAFEIDTWYHVAVTYHDTGLSTRIRIWDDTAEALLGTDATESITRGTEYGGNSPFVIGDIDSGGFTMDGYMDEFVVFNRVLNTNEIDLVRQGLYDGSTYLPFASAPSAVSALTGIDLDKQLDLLSAPSVVSVLTGIDLDKQLDFLSAPSSVSVLSAAELVIEREMLSALATVSVLSGIDVTRSMSLISAPAAVSVLSSPELDRLLDFVSTINVVSVLSGIDLLFLVQFASAVASVTTVSSVDLDKLLDYLSTSSSTSVLSSAKLAVVRELVGATTGVTTLSSAELDLLLSFLSSLTATTVLSSPIVLMERNLSSTAECVSVMSGIDVVLSGYAIFSSLCTVVAALAAAELVVVRPIQSVFPDFGYTEAVSVVSEITLNVIRELNSISASVAVLPSIEVDRLLNFLSALASVSVLSSPILSLTFNYLSTAVAQTVLSSIEMPVVRTLSSSTGIVGALSAAELAVARELISTSAVVSTLSSAEMVSLLNFLSTSAAVSTMSSPELYRLLSLLSASDSTSVLSTIDLDKLLGYVSSASAVTTMSTPNLITTLELASVAATSSGLSAAELDILRNIIGSVSGQSVVSGIDMVAHIIRDITTTTSKDKTIDWLAKAITHYETSVKDRTYIRETITKTNKLVSKEITD